MTRDLPLSVVVVTYNEESHVRQCLESVLEAMRDFPAAEVILVDSNSTDRTVEIALEYPITVLQIPSDDLTTPGAGRYVGTQFARGDLILFVDGDTTVEPGWLEPAVETLRASDDVAGVGGHLNTCDADVPRDVDDIRAVVLYDAAALAEVGGFDPFLQSVEDVHLGYRLTAAGYRLVRLPRVAATYDPPTSVAEPLRRWRNGYWFGAGQAIRASLDDRALLRKHLWRVRYKLLAGAWLCAGAAGVLLGVWLSDALLGAGLLLGWVALSFTGYGAVAAVRGRLFATQFVLGLVFGLIGHLVGLTMRHPPPSAFPLEAVLVYRRDPAPSLPSSDTAAQ